MDKREKVMKGLEVCREMNNPPGWRCTDCTECPYHKNGCATKLKEDALEQIKELSSTVGITQTATGISIIATGSAEEGMKMGLDYGKAKMHEWLGVELIRRGLMTKEIRKVFDEAKSEESK